MMVEIDDSGATTRYVWDEFLQGNDCIMTDCQPFVVAFRLVPMLLLLEDGLDRALVCPATRR